MRLPGGTWAGKPGGNWAGEGAGASKRWDKGSVKGEAGSVERDEGRGTTDEGRRTKEAAEEKEEIHIIKETVARLQSMLPCRQLSLGMISRQKPISRFESVTTVGRKLRLVTLNLHKSL